MRDSTPPRAWTSVCGRLAPLVGLRPEPSPRGVLGRVDISTNIDAPCVLARLGSHPFAACWVAGRSRPRQATSLPLDITGAWNHSSGRAVPLEEADDALHPVDPAVGPGRRHHHVVLLRVEHE